MLLKNGNKETYVLNTRFVSSSRRRRKRPPLRVLREVTRNEKNSKGKNSNFQIYLRKLCALGSFFAFLINVTSSSFSLLSLLISTGKEVTLVLGDALRQLVGRVHERELFRRE